MEQETLTYLLDNVFCCPRCRFYHIHENDLSFMCATCGWRSDPVEGDTANFARVVYETAQAKTHRIHKTKPLLQKIKAIHNKVVPWKERIIESRWYTQKERLLMHQQELGKVYRILTNVISEPKPVLLELGAGFQNHVELYQRFAEYAITSDIYRDKNSVELYSGMPNVFRSVINIEELPLRESSIDLLFSSHVVEHFPDRVKNLRDLHQIMKPGAIACHIVPITTGHIKTHILHTISNIMVIWPRLGGGVHGEYDSIWQELRQGTINAWKTLFENCGFKVISSAPGTLGLKPFVPIDVSVRLANRLHVYGSWIFVMDVVK
jgi:SAM-dependent methyltransferase